MIPLISGASPFQIFGEQLQRVLPCVFSGVGCVYVLARVVEESVIASFVNLGLALLPNFLRPPLAARHPGAEIHPSLARMRRNIGQ